MNLKEHQETIDILMETMSKKTKEVSDMKMELETTNIKLQEKVLIGHLIYSGIKVLGDIKMQPLGSSVTVFTVSLGFLVLGSIQRRPEKILLNSLQEYP